MEELNPSAWYETCWPTGRMEMGVTTESKHYSDHDPIFILAKYAFPVKTFHNGILRPRTHEKKNRQKNI